MVPFLFRAVHPCSPPDFQTNRATSGDAAGTQGEERVECRLDERAGGASGEGLPLREEAEVCENLASGVPGR